MTEHLGKLFSNPHSIPLPLWGKQFHFIAYFTIHQHVRPKNTCFRAEKNMTALKMIMFQWLHWVIITYLRLKRPKKVLQGRSPCCIPLYPSPLLMKNSSQLHLHSGKKLMAFGYKWTGKKAFLFSFFYFFWWVPVGISVHQLQKWFEAFFKSPLLFLGSVAAADSEDCVKSGRKCQKRLQSKLNGRHLTLTKTRRRKNAPF